VGYDRPRSLGRDETGSRVAVPIWTTFMAEALAGTPVEDFPVPERVILVPVDLDASGACIRPVMMAFVMGTEPGNVCGPARASSPGHTAGGASSAQSAPAVPAAAVAPAGARPQLPPGGRSESP
jgi:penicillin-binding protein 1A